MTERRVRIRRFLVWLVALGAIGAGAWFGVEAIREWRQERLADGYTKEIVARLDLARELGFSERLDQIRTFINDHSQHKVDAAFWANHGNAAAFTGGVLAHAKGEVAEPVHMECSTRTNLMARILQELGYETRVVAIFNSRTNLKSHSFLEVMNPETKRWETQDADVDIYWRRKGSGERISLAEEAESLDRIEPCGRQRCGWDHVSREGTEAGRLRHYLDIISITRKERDLRYALYTSRADLGRIYDKGSKRGTFCEVEAKRCKQGFYDIRKYSSYAAGLPRQ